LRVISFRKVQRLSWDERWLLAQALVLLPVLRGVLLFVTIKQLQLLTVRTVPNLRRGSSAGVPSRPQSALSEASIKSSLAASFRAQSTARMVRIAAERGLCRAKCLEQSLLLRWLLQRQGIDARIFLGARREDEQMQAHAWVEVDGVVLNEDDDVHQRFLPFEELAASTVN